MADRRSVFGNDDPLGGILGPTPEVTARPPRAVRSPGPARPVATKERIQTPTVPEVPAAIATSRISANISAELDARLRAWAAHHGAGNLLSAFLEDVLLRAVTEAEKKHGGPFPPPLFRRKPRTQKPR
jgi:hypothetical protein